jgi:predicted transcriptional regulator of viral defense system
MRKLKYMKQLEPFYKAPFFTIEEAEKQGVPRHALAYLEKRGDLERIYPGAYRFHEYEPQVEFQWESLGLVASSVPESVICLISALVFYDLTDQVMREIWLAVPHKSHPPKRPNTRIVRMRNTNLGKTAITLGEYHVQIFDRERCIIDAFRYLSKEIAIKALQRYFQSKAAKPDPKKLGAYAKKLRVNITPYILSFTT